MSDPQYAERLARLSLSRLTEPGHPYLSRLVGEIGATRLHDELLRQDGVRDLLQDAIARLPSHDPERDLAIGARIGARFVIPGDEEWPASVGDLDLVDPLSERGGAPLGLWVKGPMRLTELAGSVAIVGSRSATSYGESLARTIGYEVAGAGHPVVSGAAFGIDQAAHRGGAAGGRTVAVLACGLDRVYPEAHRDLIEYLARHHAVISEVPPGCAPTRQRFLTRNRVIAALTDATVVVEAAVRSGALNTANWADRLSRKLLGVPGPVTSAQSAGVHRLLRGGATLVTSGAEVLEQVGDAGAHLVQEPRGPARPRDGLQPRDAQVLEAVPVATAVEAVSIARTAGIGLVSTRAALQRLAAGGFVERTPDGWRLGAAARMP